MTEFFSPETTNERKRDIEQSLNEFAARENWKSYIDFLHLTNNNYVLMFILTTLEVVYRNERLIDFYLSLSMKMNYLMRCKTKDTS